MKLLVASDRKPQADVQVTEASHYYCPVILLCQS